MILIAATAPPLYFLKMSWQEDFESFMGQLYPSLSVKIDARLNDLSAFVLSWTLAWLILRHRRPRPPRRRLGRQPGMAACLASTVAMAAALSWAITVDLLRGHEIFCWSFPLEASFYNGHAVLATWVVLAYGGLLRREPGWIDSTGMALGGFWVARMLVRFAALFF